MRNSIIGAILPMPVFFNASLPMHDTPARRLVAMLEDFRPATKIALAGADQRRSGRIFTDCGGRVRPRATERKPSSSYFASNFIGLGSLRDSGQADIAPTVAH